MKFSAWPDPERPVAEVFALAELTEGFGWHGFWVADHYMPDDGDSEASGDVYECWTVLAALATLTSQIRIGSLVSPTSIHHPALLANRAVTIDHISNGRFVLGVGAGWQVNEHEAYGFDLLPPGKRVSQFGEALQIARSLLDNPSTTFDGAYFQLSDARCDPKPVQSELPILVGAAGARMCSFTASTAQEWNTWGAPDLSGSRMATFEAACDREGVDPRSKHCSVQALFSFDIASTTTEALSQGVVVRGGSEFLIDQIEQYRSIGFDEIVVPDFALGGSAQERCDAYAWFDEHVVQKIDSRT